MMGFGVFVYFGRLVGGKTEEEGGYSILIARLVSVGVPGWSGGALDLVPVILCVSHLALGGV